MDNHLAIADATITRTTIIVRVSRKASRKRVRRLVRKIRRTVSKYGGKYAVVVVRAGERPPDH